MRVRQDPASDMLQDRIPPPTKVDRFLSEHVVYVMSTFVCIYLPIKNISSLFLLNHIFHMKFCFLQFTNIPINICILNNKNGPVIMRMFKFTIMFKLSWKCLLSIFYKLSFDCRKWGKRLRPTIRFLRASVLMTIFRARGDIN